MFFSALSMRRYFASAAEGGPLVALVHCFAELSDDGFAVGGGFVALIYSGAGF